MEGGGGWLVFGSMIGVSLSLKELGGRREGGGKRAPGLALME